MSLHIYPEKKKTNKHIQLIMFQLINKIKYVKRIIFIKMMYWCAIGVYRSINLHGNPFKESCGAPELYEMSHLATKAAESC